MEMLHLAEMMQIIMRTGLVGRDWPMGYSSYQIENGRGVHVVKLFLREQWREKDSFPDALTVVHIRAVDRGRECPLGRIGCIYVKKFQKLL